jgi:antitoxin component YwqK of YwqJK toxin-antitoxin module
MGRRRRKFQTKSKDTVTKEIVAKNRVVVEYYDNGKVLCKRWLSDGMMIDGKMCNGVLHRNDGPAWVTWYSDGSVAFESWFVNGRHIKYVHHAKKKPDTYTIRHMSYTNDMRGKVDTKYTPPHMRRKG